MSCDSGEVRLRLLIVDDSARFLESARTFLEREEIAVVGVASSSAEALRLAEELRPDATLVDIDLGEENGFHLAQQLAANAGSPSNVILVSTYPEDGFAELIDASPALGFVSKTRLSAKAIFEMLDAS
jgi:DNA-binding NarL/FixJ family response regulator